MRFLKLLPLAALAAIVIAGCDPFGRGQGVDTASKEETLADSLITLELQTLYTDPLRTSERLSQHCDSALDSAVKMRYKLYMAYSLFVGTGEQDSSLRIYDEVMRYCKEHPGNDRIEGIAWNHRGIILTKTAPDSMEACMNHAIKAMERAGRMREVADICINLADRSLHDGKMAQAASLFHKAWFLADSTGYTDAMMPIQIGLGQTYTDLMNFDTAREHMRKAAKYYDNVQDFDRYLYHLANGNLYYHEENCDSAMAQFIRAKAIADRFQDYSLMLPVIIDMAEIYLMTDNLELAHSCLDDIITKIDHSHNYDEDFYANSLYATLLLKEHKPERAKPYVEKAEKAENIGLRYRYLHYRRLAQAYKEIGRYKETAELTHQMNKCNARLRNITLQNNIIDISERYKQDTILLNRDLQIAENRILIGQQQRMLLGFTCIVVTLVMLSIMTVLYFRMRARRRHNKMLNSVIQLRMENTRNRITPHFFLNALNATIPSLNQNEQTRQTLDELLQLIRMNLLCVDKMTVELNEEIELVKRYTNLYIKSHEAMPNVVWNIDESVDRHVQVPTMCIQIPVENALKHAFTPDIEAPSLTIDIRNDSGTLLIRIEDNGLGLGNGSHGGSANGTGNGLKMLYRVVELLNIDSANRITINVDAADPAAQKGTRVTYSIPIENNGTRI